MEFHITMSGTQLDVDVIEEAIGMLDPAAVVDIDASGDTLRVSTSVDALQLAALINQAGYPVAAHQVRQLPSICCGSCSG